MKTCSKCCQELPLKAFSKRKDGKQGRAGQCRDCRSDYYRDAYKNNPERRKQVSRAVWNRKKRLSKWVQTLKEKPCADCGVQYPYYVMDFDHRDPSKKAEEMNRIFLKGWSKKRIMQEVKKCDVVCANCHRIRTFRQVAQSG